VFHSRKGGGHLDPVQVHRIVKAAAHAQRAADYLHGLQPAAAADPDWRDAA